MAWAKINVQSEFLQMSCVPLTNPYINIDIDFFARSPLRPFLQPWLVGQYLVQQSTRLLSLQKPLILAWNSLHDQQHIQQLPLKETQRSQKPWWEVNTVTLKPTTGWPSYQLRGHIFKQAKSADTRWLHNIFPFQIFSFLQLDYLESKGGCVFLYLKAVEPICLCALSSSR